MCTAVAAVAVHRTTIICALACACPGCAQVLVANGLYTNVKLRKGLYLANLTIIDPGRWGNPSPCYMTQRFQISGKLKVLANKAKTAACYSTIFG